MQSGNASSQRQLICQTEASQSSHQVFGLFCRVLIWSVLMMLEQVSTTLSSLWLLALQMDGLPCAWALTLIRLDMAPDIMRVYRALSINRPGDLD